MGQEAKVMMYPVRDLTDIGSDDVAGDQRPAKSASTKQSRVGDEVGRRI